MSKEEKKPETPKGGAATDARAVLADTETASEKIADSRDSSKPGAQVGPPRRLYPMNWQRRDLSAGSNHPRSCETACFKEEASGPNCDE